MPLIYPFTVSQNESGEYLWSGLYRCAAASDGSEGSAGVRGAYRLGGKGEDLGRAGFIGAPKHREALWEHTLQETNTIEK
jgi:hypothetical protein